MSTPALAVITLVVLANVAAVAVAVVRARHASNRMRDILTVRLERYVGGFGSVPDADAYYASEQGTEDTRSETLP